MSKMAISIFTTTGLPRGPLLATTALALCLVAALFVGLRFWSTWSKRGFFGREEAMLAASLV